MPTPRQGRRQAAKNSTQILAYRNNFGLGPNIALRVLDISESGARIVLKEEMPIGKEFEMSFEAIGVRPVKAMGKIVWCVKADDGSFIVGAAFEKSLNWSAFSSMTRTS